MSQTESLYKVILPFNSHMVHSSKSVNGGGSKCYKEIKSQMGGVDLFSIMNVNTNKVYNFKTKSNKLNKNTLNQDGGFLSNLNEIKSMNDRIKILESRLITLENIANNAINHNTIKGGAPFHEAKFEAQSVAKFEANQEVFSETKHKAIHDESKDEAIHNDSKQNLESKQKKLIESLKIL